ncbi:helix-turn-helix domain-containing protein [Mucilaginibacter sp. JRF]|uniref:AraC family transcriptional regulator n=1 Tax=Mucilaginibacter sp. JRF TaxID=2780088 RepID=UPI001882BA74|nr:AraC family transcriptional regulator [Mucilaginibacter sp. JRF]MBE9586213.1 helix-turn-helix domain-containing protein [Mucilaginibacter sp. JRF]
MKRIIPKSPIPESRSFVIKRIDAPYFDPTFHLHKEFQMSYVVKGEGTRFVGDNVKSFTHGDMVLTGPYLPHVWRNDNAYFEKKSELSTTVVVIYLNDNFLGETVHQKEEMESIGRLLVNAARGIEVTGHTKQVIAGMMLDLLDMRGFESIIQLLKILNVMSKSTDCHFITHNHPVSANTEAETNRMNKIYNYVMKNFRQKIMLDDVAAIANMTNTSFSRYFKARVNKSFSDFVKEIRIEQACKLLKEEKLNINDIGYECGFKTLSNFNKQFKTVMKKQPHQYRNEYLEVSVGAYRD